MLVIFPENFTIDPDGINVPNIEIYYNSSDNDSLKLREKISTLLDTLRPEVFTINADASVKYDPGEEHDRKYGPGPSGHDDHLRYHVSCK